MFDAPTIYIVDDDEAVRHSLSRLFMSFDFDVKSFGSGAEFLTSMEGDCGHRQREKQYPECNSCLILDLFMPDMNGLELLQELARKTISISTIMISGHADEVMEAEALRAGVHTFLHKPFMNAHLMDAIKSLFGGAGGNDQVVH